MKSKKTRKHLEPNETMRRLMILSLIAQGVQVKDIADTLGIGSSAISNVVHVTSFKKSKKGNS